nr:immunoglobulin heavy chain junction region [Macaca mulatta]MOW46924.1 immunoglobulin heavy chain junction region [Macaca mulatta]MOW49542.1 immunoglobulin heavy chain junction region [Macaca mulatta]MOW50522.1 immunoglobulin heavy chain junction region [Macaca mulatta]MOW50950.1 immunoglobulin heavy chain junction region [Macaca mulatta]
CASGYSGTWNHWYFDFW